MIRNPLKIEDMRGIAPAVTYKLIHRIASFKSLSTLVEVLPEASISISSEPLKCHVMLSPLSTNCHVPGHRELF